MYARSADRCASLSQTFFSLVSSLLAAKMETAVVNAQAVEALQSGSYSLLHDRPLRCLWLHTSHFQKHGRQFSSDGDAKRRRVDRGKIPAFRSATVFPSPSEVFKDVTLPLIIDVGCGYGATLIGLCYDQMNCQRGEIDQEFNFLGCDMSATCVRYASGLSTRWNLNSSCRFFESGGLECLEWIRETYEGPIEWILLQFPTPFAYSTFAEPFHGNSIT